jgi:hypothetical protein
MEAQSDFRDLLALFNAQKVKYIVVGGYALAFHGAPRFTGDKEKGPRRFRGPWRRMIQQPICA